MIITLYKKSIRPFATANGLIDFYKKSIDV